MSSTLRRTAGLEGCVVFSHVSSLLCVVWAIPISQGLRSFTIENDKPDQSSTAKSYQVQVRMPTMQTTKNPLRRTQMDMVSYCVSSRHVQVHKILTVICSRNCLRYGSVCEFTTRAGKPVVFDGLTDPLLWSSDMHIDIGNWTTKGEVPRSLHGLMLPSHPALCGLSREDLRIIYHIAQFTIELKKNGSHMFTFMTMCLPQ